MFVKLVIQRAITYFGYVIASIDVLLSWFLMGSPLVRGLNVGYWGLTFYNSITNTKNIEVQGFEAYGITGNAALILNFVLTYIHLLTIASLFLIFVYRIYLRLKNGKEYKSNGYFFTSILGFIVIVYIVLFNKI